jgi:tetratricopeptide (TPR) repeat protein
MSLRAPFRRYADRHVHVEREQKARQSLLAESRPYMRARLGLALALWDGGKHDDTLAHFRELLRLNPGDNQGVRYVLASALCELQRDADLNALLEHDEFRGDSAAAWVYTRALLAFRREGDGARARRLLSVARAGNPHVPVYLLGKRKLPRQLPDYTGFGDESEAIAYASDFGKSWRATPGALSWLGWSAPVRGQRPK